MPTFSFRTEEFALGALLYAPERLRDVPDLRPHHFGDADHQAIFKALTQIREADPRVRGEELVHRITRNAAVPQVTRARLVGLALTCPDVDHVVEEARLVIAQAVRRELNNSAEQLSRLTEHLPADYPFMNYRRLLDSMHRHAINTGPDIDFALNTESNGKHPSVQREEALLAELIQKPDRIEDVAAWLTPDAFTSSNRQDLYRTLLHLDGRSEQLPNMPFTIADEIKALWNGTATQPSAYVAIDQYSPSQNLSYITHIAASTIEPGSAIETARDLMRDLVRAETRTLGNDRVELIHTEEAWIRYVAGMPPRQTDRALFEEWNQLDAEDLGPDARGSRPKYRHLNNATIADLAIRSVDRMERAQPDNAVLNAQRQREHAAHLAPLSADHRTRLEPPF